MDNHYDKKQHDRRKELNSRRNPHKTDDGQLKHRRNQKVQLVREQMDDFQSVQSTGFQSLNSETSVSSDDDAYKNIANLASIAAQENENVSNVMFAATTTMNEVPDNVKLAQWITTARELSVTRLDRLYINPFSMKNKCRKAEPVIDNTILDDLQRIFDDLSPFDLSNLVCCCQKLPYWIRSADGSLNERAKGFMADHNLTESQLICVNEIGKKILLRSSNGVLFVQGTKFFAKTNPNYKKRRSAIKGYPILKPTGELEYPWETAVRITERDVQHWNTETEEWEWFNMNEHTTENERQNYLECLVTGEKGTEVLRYIGLFIIRLKPDIQIRINDENKVDNHENWYSIDDNMGNSAFYTILPFLKYLREHRDFI
jgi:hypothetical protein